LKAGIVGTGPALLVHKFVRSSRAFHVKTQEEIEEELREAIRAARESELHMNMTLRLAEKEAVSE